MAPSSFSEKQPLVAGRQSDLPITNGSFVHKAPEKGRRRRVLRYAACVTIALWALHVVIDVASLVWEKRSARSSSDDASDPFHLKPCKPSDPSSSRYLCGHLTVPLDYTNTSDPRTVDLAITVLRAKSDGKRSKRTLVTNPGGPGGSGTEFIWRRGEAMQQNYTGGAYDVLSFDPRGVNMSDPSMSCFPTDALRDRWQQKVWTFPETGGMAAIEAYDAYNEAVMSACAAKWGDIPRFLSTAFVARDVDEIRKALGEDELTAFMVSYGTGILQTYAQMFPHRVGRCIADGMEFVVDGQKPWGWALTSLHNVTAAFEEGLVGECIAAGPDRCALAQHGVTASSLSRRIHALLDRIKHRPIPGYSDKLGPGIVTYELALEWLYGALYNPQAWPKVARGLFELEGGNATLALEQIGAKWDDKPSSKPSSAELSPLVICGDSYDAERHDLEWWADLHPPAVNQSFISASPRLYSVLPCRHFNWSSAEVYRGNFSAELKNPLLLISETHDPATPEINGRRLAAAMGDRNARLIIHHGYGHASAKNPSHCTDETIRAMLLDGKVEDKVIKDCYADEKPYPHGGEEDHFDFASIM